jgi:demethylmenaquinone methyltransferase/2-methoxy-6-polyprenyl-1,4-benzoquinol methylase
MNLFQEPEARVLIADLGLPEGSRGLDVGCGAGLFAVWLAEAIGSKGRVVGIEPSTERVEAARALVGHGPFASRLEFREGDATKLEAPDATFDWVWCGDVLHHIQETGRALGEFARVIRPGGRIVVKESQLLHGVFLPGHPPSSVVFARRRWNGVVTRAASSPSRSVASARSPRSARADCR